jgi:PAS domain S-box-containing protein
MNNENEIRMIDFHCEERLDITEILELYITLLNSTHNAIVAIDNSTRIIFMNRAAEELIGIPFSEAKGVNNTTVVPESQLQRVIETSKAETGVKVNIGGRFVICNRSPILHHGKIIGAVSVFQDISDLEFVAKELALVKQMNEELNTIIDSVYDGLIISDGKGFILRISPSYESIANVKPADFVGKHVTQLIAEGFVSESVAMKVIETKSQANLSIQVKTGKDLFHSAVPVFDENGEVSRVVTVIRDLTELTNLRRKLEEVEAEKSLYRDEVKRIKDRNGTRDLVSYSLKMKNVFQLADRIAQFDTTVLISGESGVGKEMVARYIHENSLRKNKPFIRVNCGAIPEHLLESELFGYEAGAFTGANRGGKKGLLDAANESSFLLDEISELPLLLQVKLLRFLQDQEFFRVGGSVPVQLNIRFMATSNKDLHSLVDKGGFRADLFYRLNVVQIFVPPLRERKEEIPALVMIFLKRFNDKYRQNKQMTKHAIGMLRDYDWPGNIRELENTIERLAITCPDDLITHHHLLTSTSSQLGLELSTISQSAHEPITGLKKSLNNLEKEIIRDAYEQSGCTRKAAQLLGINQSTVVKKMKKYGLRYYQ